MSTVRPDGFTGFDGPEPVGSDAPTPDTDGLADPDDLALPGPSSPTLRPAPGQARPDRSLATLGACARFFFGKASVRIITPLLVAVTVLRVREGGWGWGDLLVAVGILALEPFTEWGIHVHVLHFKPRTWRGHRVDLHAAAKHRAHHRNPGDPHSSFVPLPDLAALGVAGYLVFWMVTRGDHGTLLTASMVGLGMLLTYEWTHFLIHTAYPPRGRYYRALWRAHRWHHYRNEHYWMGVTVHLADHVLGTFPDRSEVPTSPTARTLGVEE